MDAVTRGVHRRQITLLTKSTNDYLKVPETQPRPDNSENFDEVIEELSVQLARLKNARENLRIADTNILANLKPEDYEKEQDAIADYDDKVVSSISRINVRLERLKSLRDQTLFPPGASLPSHEHTRGQKSTMKLPKIDLKKFSGDHKEWLPFWEQFDSLVHGNDSLSTREKFSYLQTVLYGKAAATITGFSPTAACYDAAISLLQEEYGDVEKIVDKHIQQLISLNSISSRHDVAGLRRLYNDVICNTRSLTTLGIPSSNYYVTLKTVLLKCLPQDLRVEYHRIYDSQDVHQQQEKVENDAQSVSSASNSSTMSFAIDKGVKFLLKFLKREIEALERAGVADRKPSTSNSTFTTKAVKTAAGLLTPTDGKKICIFCKNNNHFSDACEAPLKLEEKKAVLSKQGRCFKCTRRGHTSRHCKVRLHCRRCNGHHALSLCESEIAKRSEPKGEKKLKESVRCADPITTNLCSANSFSSNVHLQTACAFVSTSAGRDVATALLVRIVFDSGSQRSYITQRIADKLDLPVVDKVKIRILPFGSSKKPPTQLCSRVRISLRSQHDNSLTFMTAVVVPEICVDTLPIPDSNDSRFSRFTLADSRILGEPEDGISVLIGSDFYWRFVSGKVERIANELAAVHTKLGWTIQGPLCNNHVSEFESVSMYVSSSLEEGSPDDVSRMWDLEVLGIKPPDAEHVTLDFDRYVKRMENYYEGSLLWLEARPKLHSYRESAFKRFHGLVRRLSRNPKALTEYDSAMIDLIKSGVAEPVNYNEEANDRPIYYMPHPPVYREDKATTKLRIVFDASARLPGEASLNDLLSAGPNLLPDILSILLNFRIGTTALVADIEKAFLQIRLCRADKDVHRFFWFKQPIESTTHLPAAQEYRMTRVTFGVKCSPFLLEAVIQKHLETESLNFPDVCSLLKKSFYMDDLVTSVNEPRFAFKVYSETSRLMKHANMNIRKWNTNDATLRTILAEKTELPIKQKVLGLFWNCLTDEIFVDLEPAHESILHMASDGVTKRTILQLMARVFDPLGILAPFTVKLKMLFQKLWRLKLSWDENIPTELMKIWRKCQQEFSDLNEVFLPRCLTDVNKASSVQLHLFADASPLAYGAVAFLRTKSRDVITTKFVCSKNRLAPILKQNKQLTLPKLELTAALIAARLCKHLIDNLNISLSNIFLWTDSKIVHHWINGDLRRWNVYVANRVREIRQCTLCENWRHCPGESNPADFLTRDVFGKNLTNSLSWLTGPLWLSKDEEEWPQIVRQNNSDVELSLISLQPVESFDDTRRKALLDLTNFSSYMRLLRVTAYVQRFVRQALKIQITTSKFLVSKEIKLAELFWIKFIQEECYDAEMKALKDDKSIPANSPILSLNPMMDTEGVIRVGTRLQFMDLNYESTFPAILPRSNHLVKLIIIDTHHRLLHGGVNAVLTRIREKFWIPRARQMIKTVLKDCRICRRLFSRPMTHPFAPLPRSRLISTKPFETVGIDFAGPLFVKWSSTDTSTVKSYIMLLTCATVRAVHLELVPNLGVESCILGLRRFFARRGLPNLIISDNARTFKRAAKELKVLGSSLFAKEFQEYLANNKISWEFIVERAPWWGGFWERLVRSVKNALKLVIGKATLSFEEMQTVLAEAESMINSRPLTYVNDDPKDLNPLTPSHFLQSSNPSALDFIPDTVRSASAVQIRELWKTRFKLMNALWKRWRIEYIQQLRTLHQTTKGCFGGNLNVGDVVLMYEQHAPRLLWRLAIIERAYPGRDGRVRACEIRISDGSLFRRSVQHLYPLELQHDESSETSPARPEDVEN